jgi:hypothetical protein
MGFSYYQDAGEEEERPPDRWASVRLSRLFLSLKTLSSTAAVPTMYSIFTCINSVIQHTSLSWLQAMPSCVRAPYRTSEPRRASVFCEISPCVYVGAYTDKDCTRRTVRAYLSDFSNFHRVVLHPTLNVVASHEVLASRIPGARRSRVVPPVPGPPP